MGMYVTSSLFPVFASYASNISLNDWFQRVSWLDAVEQVLFAITYLDISGNCEGAILQLFSR